MLPQVQRIKNEFTVEVYEIHARIALEAVSQNFPSSVSPTKLVLMYMQKDLGEYNQCQTMLRQLYELGLKGHPQEFLSYRIIYLLHTRNRSGQFISQFILKPCFVNITCLRDVYRS